MPKKILIISPVATHPQTSGSSIRVYALCDALKNMGHDVHFLHVTRQRCDQTVMESYWGPSLTMVPWLPWYRRFGNAIKKRCMQYTGYPANWNLDDWYPDHISNTVQELHHTHQFDIVITEYVYLSKAFEVLPDSVHKIIDTHSVFTNRHQLCRKNNVQPSFFSVSKEGELRGLRRSRSVIGIQTEETAWFAERLPEQTCVTIGHLAHCTDNRICTAKKNTVLFFAGSAAMNRHALDWLLQKIWPRVRQQHCNAELLLAGSISKNAAIVDGIRCVPYVDSLDELYRQTSIVVNPQQFGTGLSMKTIEALAYGKALVSTSCGARGLSDSPCFIADEPAAFADHICQLLQSDTKRTELEETACKWSKKQYERNTETLSQLLEHFD